MSPSVRLPLVELSGAAKAAVDAGLAEVRESCPDDVITRDLGFDQLIRSAMRIQSRR
jgi:hypothetical protein